ncbi:hypothetical protein PINS_up006232 [Pythium insidiosum]|nr:hypothetical protein PINS_up006232 [Pythium insidiosum]
MAPRVLPGKPTRRWSRASVDQVFHVSLLFNLALRHDTRRPWWTRIQEHLVLGALPLRNKGHLESEGVKAVVTMNQPIELQPNFICTPVTPEDWESRGVPQCIGSTSDFTPPTLETVRHCVAFIREQTEAKKTTYVHCKAGSRAQHCRRVGVSDAVPLDVAGRGTRIRQVQTRPHQSASQATTATPRLCSISVMINGRKHNFIFR